MAKEVVEALLDEVIGTCADPEEKQTLQAIKLGTDAVSLPEELVASEKEEVSEKNQEDMFHIITKAKLPQKIKLALYGNKVARNLLIRERSRQVSLLVLENPRLTEGEVEEFSKNTGLDEAVFRNISQNTTWMKNYSVKLNIVANPRVPVDVSLRWIKFLQDRDLKALSRSKNISQIVATQCRKLAEKRVK